MGHTSLSSRRLARDLRIWIRDVSPVLSSVPANGELEERDEDGPESPESPPSSPSSAGGLSAASTPSPQSTQFPSSVLASSTAPPPALGPAASSTTTAGIVTLTAIPHTPTFPSSTAAPSSFTTSVTSVTSATSVLAAPPVPSTSSVSTTELQSLQNPTSSRTTSSSSAETTAPSGGAQEQNSVQKIDSNEGSAGKGIHVVLPVLASIAVLGALIFFFFRWRKHRKRSQEKHLNALPGPNGGSVSSFPPDYQPRVDGKTNTKIMDELMSAAYAAENGGAKGHSTYWPNGYITDEKFASVPEPEPVTLRGLRHSIARFFRGQYPPKIPVSFGTANGQQPPVPAVPDAFKPGGLNGPQLVESQFEPHPGTRIKTFWSDGSQRDTMGSAGQNGTLLSLYATESHGLGYFHKQRPQSGSRFVPPAPPALRVPSDAPSAAELETPSEEGTWRTWGVSQTPKTPTRNWVEKCIRAGGLR